MRVNGARHPLELPDVASASGAREAEVWRSGARGARRVEVCHPAAAYHRADALAGGRPPRPGAH